MSDGVRVVGGGGKCEVVGQTGQGCDAMVKGRDCETVGRAG